uniref:Peptidyl-prolyl cis-trans isomerase E n=1 Tax=Homo sapiens TaxID=9606 RepID=UPI00005FB0FF|nr:Chain A, Peptidyl-prolyl cis-trans isomerase E [Homo sapiens]
GSSGSSGMATTKRVLYVGGLAEEVDDKVLHAAFIPFGDITDIQIPLDYETEKHRGFAFVEFELAEDAAAAIDNMNESELFGRTIRVNLAKPMRIKESGPSSG